MSLSQLKERLLNLEQVVAQLQPPSTHLPKIVSEDPTELLPGVEYPLVTSVSPKRCRVVTAVIVETGQAPVRVGLSDAEWRDFGPEESDERRRLPRGNYRDHS